MTLKVKAIEKNNRFKEDNSGVCRHVMQACWGGRIILTPAVVLKDEPRGTTILICQLRVAKVSRAPTFLNTLTQKEA